MKYKQKLNKPTKIQANTSKYAQNTNKNTGKSKQIQAKSHGGHVAKYKQIQANTSKYKQITG